MMLLPPREGVCQDCASEHAPELPHNAQSLYYQVSRHMQNLPCNWLTAMEHCTPATQAVWTAALEEKGVDVAGGGINPVRQKKAARK